MPTWNCTKIKRVRRIVNTAWVDIKFWSLRRWNWKTQLMMMKKDEVKTIFTHTSPSYLFWRSKFGTNPYLLMVCIGFQSNTSQFRESNYIMDWWALEHILWDLLKLGTMAQVSTHPMLIKALEISEMTISHWWLNWKYLESGQRACGGDRCQRLSCNKFHRQTGRGHHCAASQVSRGISRLGIYSTWEQTRELQTGWDTTELPQMFLRSSN